jgi:hypothetical protein
MCHSVFHSGRCPVPRYRLVRRSPSLLHKTLTWANLGPVSPMARELRRTMTAAMVVLGFLNASRVFNCMIQGRVVYTPRRAHSLVSTPSSFAKVKTRRHLEGFRRRQCVRPQCSPSTVQALTGLTLPVTLELLNRRRKHPNKTTNTKHTHIPQLASGGQCRKEREGERSTPHR